MKQRLTFLLPFVALAAMAVVNGCGDDDDDYPNPSGAGGVSGASGRSGAGRGGMGVGGGGQGGVGGGDQGGAGAGQGGGDQSGGGQGGGEQGGAGQSGGGQGGAGGVSGGGQGGAGGVSGGGQGGAGGVSGAGQGGGGQGGAGQGGAGQGGVGGAGQGGASGVGGAGQGGAGQAGAGQGGAGQAGAGQGGAGQAGASGGAGAGGGPVVVPGDKCENAPVVALPPNQLGTIVEGQSLSSAKNDYAFTCQGKAVNDGPELVFGLSTPTTGVLTVRTRDLDPTLDVAILALPACGGGSGDDLGCGNQLPKGLDETFAFVTEAAPTVSYVFVEHTNFGQTPAPNFSLDAYFNQASTQTSNSCAPAPAPITVPILNLNNPEVSDVLVTGTTVASGADFSVPTAGLGSCSNPPPELNPATGPDDVVALTPQASGTLFGFIQPLPGDANYRPVVWARSGGCQGATTLACAVSDPSGFAATSFDVTAGTTYHVVVDSLNAATAGSYLATFVLLPGGVKIEAQPSPKREGGQRYVVRSAQGEVLRIIDPTRPLR